MARRFYWLKLTEDFFRRLEVKRLRKMPGGDTLVIIYQSLLLLSLKTDGRLIYKGYEQDLAEELALELDEEIDSVRAVLLFLQSRGLIRETEDPNAYELEYAVAMIGSESDSAERMRRYRERQAAALPEPPPEAENVTEPAQNVRPEALQSDAKTSQGKTACAQSDASASLCDREKRRDREEIRDRQRVEEKILSPKAGERDSASQPEKAKKKANEQEQAERFDWFWSLYPKKKGKEAARKAWRKLSPPPDLFSLILDALENAKKSEEWKRDGGRYIPYPATWINGKRWEDEIDPREGKGGGSLGVGGALDALQAIIDRESGRDPLEIIPEEAT